MDEATFKTWEALHRRLSRGETLNAEEQAVHEAGRQQLHAEETIYFDFEELRRIKAQIAALDAENEELRARRAQLDAEIAEMEANPSPHLRELSQVGD